MWRSDHCQYYRLMWHIPHRKTMHRYAYCGAMQYWRLYLACGAETAILFLFHHEQIPTSGFYESDHDYCGKRHTATQTDEASGEKKQSKGEQGVLFWAPLTFWSLTDGLLNVVNAVICLQIFGASWQSHNVLFFSFLYDCISMNKRQNRGYSI